MLSEIVSLRGALTDVVSIISKPKTFLIGVKAKSWIVFITKTIRLFLLAEIILMALSIPFSYSKISIFKELLVIDTIWNLLYPIGALCCFCIVNLALNMQASLLEIFYYAFMYRMVVMFPSYLFYIFYLYTENVYFFIANTYLLYISALIFLSGYGILYGKTAKKKTAAILIVFFIIYGIGIIINKIDTYSYVSESIIKKLPIYDPISKEFSTTINYCLDKQEHTNKINKDFIDLCDDYGEQILNGDKKLSREGPSVEREYELLKKENIAIIKEINIYMEKIKYNSSKKTLRYICELIEIETDIAKYAYEGYGYIKKGAYGELAERLKKRIDKMNELGSITNEYHDFVEIKINDIRILMKHDRIWFLPAYVMD